MENIEEVFKHLQDRDCSKCAKVKFFSRDHELLWCKLIRKKSVFTLLEQNLSHITCSEYEEVENVDENV